MEKMTTKSLFWVISHSKVAKSLLKQTKFAAGKVSVIGCLKYFSAY